MRLGEYLVGSRKLEMEALYQALSFQQGLPLAQVEPETVPWPVAHALPEHAIRQWQVLPFRIAEQNLFVASPEAAGSRNSAGPASVYLARNPLPSGDARRV